MKIRPVGSELFHADGQTHITKLTVAFRNFTNVSKNNIKVKTNKPTTISNADVECDRKLADSSRHSV
jgi:hypothetical protein